MKWPQERRRGQVEFIGTSRRETGDDVCKGVLTVAFHRVTEAEFVRERPGEIRDVNTGEEKRMNPIEGPPRIVRWTLRLEDVTALDRPVHALEPPIRALFGSGTKGSLLRGDWLGHAVHPLLTDVALGTWTSASVLDLLGGPGSSAAAQRLIGTGLLAAGPTAWTGWAEWSAAGSRDKRVGLVHAVTNGVAIGVYAASWFARRRGRHSTGARLALAAAAVSGIGGYLGGHLAEARKVASHHPAYDDSSAGV